MPGQQAFADLSSWRKIAVSGGESLTWLNDLVSANLSDLAPGRARRSLLLSPTGRVRAEFTVAVPGGTLLLIQDPVQPEPIDRLLSPYTLSSDVVLDDRTDELALFAFPGAGASPDAPGTAVSAPSCVGPGADLLALIEDHDRLLATLSKTFSRLTDEDLEAWRIAAGIARFGVDAGEGDLPQEGGLEDAVAFDKGCYLGQEAVAKVRNLGHPRRILLRLETDEPVSAGEPIHVNGQRAGKVTSAAAMDGLTSALVRVRWEEREGPFRSAGGAELRLR